MTEHVKHTNGARHWHAQVGQVAAMAALTVPLAARADAIEDIAAKANAKAKAQREEALSAPPEVEQTDEEKLQPIIGALAASVVLSVPFFAENLKVRPPPNAMTH
tara:strand:+ start:264 stop:578 length:315 start_codon:yes stop_codon:yes gene_type:complete